ncbi:uncharacterized protein KZ484_007798 [Pholidichthys leucotaenia]
MSRIIGVVLLFIILIDSFCDSTADSLDVSWLKAIRKCRCKDTPRQISKRGVPLSVKKICPSPLIPKSKEEKEKLIECICSKTNQYNVPKLKFNCRFMGSDPPL